MISSMLDRAHTSPYGRRIQYLDHITFVCRTRTWTCLQILQQSKDVFFHPFWTLASNSPQKWTPGENTRHQRPTAMGDDPRLLSSFTESGVSNLHVCSWETMAPVTYCSSSAWGVQRRMFYWGTSRVRGQPALIYWYALVSNCSQNCRFFDTAFNVILMQNLKWLLGEAGVDDIIRLSSAKNKSNHCEYERSNRIHPLVSGGGRPDKRSGYRSGCTAQSRNGRTFVWLVFNT